MMKLNEQKLREMIREAIMTELGPPGASALDPAIVEELTDEIGDRAAGGYEPSIDGSPEAFAEMIIDSYLREPPPPLNQREHLEFVLTNHRDEVEAKILEYIGMMT